MPETSIYRKNFQGSHPQAQLSVSCSRSRKRATGGGRTLAVSMLMGMFAVLAPACHAQANPQTLPGYHTIVAGSGTQYGTVTLLSGPATGGAPVHGSAPGDGSSATASAAQLNGPNALAFDSLGNLYIVDSSGPVRKVDTNGNITTFAAGLNLEGGKSKNPYPCAAASAIATAKTPNIYPIYGDGCPANEAYLGGAFGIAIDPTSGDIYISESSGYRIRKINHSTYIVTTVAGTGTKGGTNGDLDTCASPATCSGTVGLVCGTRGLAVDKHGNLYMADTTNSAIRLANFSTGQLTTVVNTAEVLATATTCTTSATATTAGAAVTGAIQSLAFDRGDNLYFSDATCNVVYKGCGEPGDSHGGLRLHDQRGAWQRTERSRAGRL